MSKKKDVYSAILNWTETYNKYHPKELGDLAKIIHKEIELLSEQDAKEMLTVHLIDYVVRDYIFPIKNITDKINGV